MSGASPSITGVKEDMKQVREDIIMHPRREKGEKIVPARGLFFVNPAEASYAIDLVLGEGGSRRFLFHSALAVNADSTFFVAGPAIGAPMAAMTLEKLIALGAERVIMGGWCGALDRELKIGDCLLGGTAYCGEGTSRYYGGEEYVEPANSLVARLQESIIESTVGSVWSTDAPYRESRSMFAALVAKYQIAGVDMEYSALCSVADFRNIEFAGAFLVSDELWADEWRPGFTRKSFRKKSHQLTRILLDMLAS